MAFGVFVRLEGGNPATTRVNEVIAWGDPPKPNAGAIPGPAKKNVTQRCHIIAWDLYSRNYNLRFLGKTVEQIARDFNYNGPGEIGPMVSYIENAIAENFKRMNNDVTLYYNGKASENTSAGASYRVAKEKCDSVYNEWNRWSQLNPMIPMPDKLTHLSAELEEPQWSMFVNGFDSPPTNLFSPDDVRAYKLQYIQVYQSVITGQMPDLYYRYFYAIDTPDFLSKAQIRLARA